MSAPVNSLVTSVVERLPAPVRHAPHKVFPRHASFLLGEVALLSFAVLVVTGLYLTWFYDASGEPVIYDGSYEPLHGVEVSRAYASVMDITFDRPLGSVIRQTHHWAALVFVAALVLHAMRVFFTGAFRRPRRANWVVGLVLMGLAMANGFFGLALPNDLLGGTGTRIGHAFAVSIPVIGPGVADLLFAGEFGEPASLHRFWLLHVIALPLLIVGALSVHLALIWTRTHTQFTDEHTARTRVVGSTGWPDYASKTVGLSLLVASTLLAMGATLQIAPIWIYGPFDPAAATVPAQPDWYLGWVEGALRIVPNLDVIVAGSEIPSPFFTGVLLPLVVFGVLATWPLVEERVTGDCAEHHVAERPRDRPVRTALGVAGLAGLTVLLAGGSHDLQAFMLRVPIGSVTTAYRVLLVVVPVVSGLVAWSTCRALVRGESPPHGPER
ncbi:MAG TPA: cytochrome bc complex cytochrome b subunit [Ilumatobacteraceae bacterium]|nr:cytochrome bc complex cytochrome b subunit [Ilumatobacteraceae bacterium]